MTNSPPNHARQAYLLILTSILFTSLACQLSGSSQADDLPPQAQPASATWTPDTAWYDIYFTEPGSAQSETLRGGPDLHLATAIRTARASVDMAVLQLDLWSIRDALLDAHRRGVTVRVVTDSDYLDEVEIQDLLQAGVSVLGDRREGLMHNKFVVIDRQEVWTGSMNFTISETYRNNNNLIRIRSTKLAENYTNEFEEMYLDDKFGAFSPTNTPHPILKINGVQTETYFSPDDQTEVRLMALLREAKDSIQFMAYSFTSDNLADVILARAREGVSVSGVMEASQYQSNAGTDFNKFLDAGLDIRLDANPKNMHHKVLIIDGRIVITGSYNFSYYAENRNDENTLILHDANIAAIYQAEFEKLFQGASIP